MWIFLDNGKLDYARDCGSPVKGEKTDDSTGEKCLPKESTEDPNASKNSTEPPKDVDSASSWAELKREKLKIIFNKRSTKRPSLAKLSMLNNLFGDDDDDVLHKLLPFESKIMQASTEKSLDSVKGSPLHESLEQKSDQKKILDVESAAACDQKLESREIDTVGTRDLALKSSANEKEQSLKVVEHESVDDVGKHGGGNKLNCDDRRDTPKPDICAKKPRRSSPSRAVKTKQDDGLGSKTLKAKSARSEPTVTKKLEGSKSDLDSQGLSKTLPNKKVNSPPSGSKAVVITDVI